MNAPTHCGACGGALPDSEFARPQKLLTLASVGIDVAMCGRCLSSLGRLPLDHERIVELRQRLAP